MPKGSFQQDGKHQWRSITSVKPITKYHVTLKDLPSEIDVMDNASFEAYFNDHR